MFLFALSLASLGWMHRVVRRMMAEGAPEVATHIEHGGAPGRRVVRGGDLA